MNIHKGRALAAFVILASLSVHAAAEEPTETPATDAATPFYGSIGYMESYTFAQSNVWTSNIWTGAITGRLGYEFNRSLAVEFEASTGVVTQDASVGFGGVSNSSIAMKDQYAAYAVERFPLSSKFALLARLGVGSMTLREKDYLNNFGGPTSVVTEATRTIWNVGLGAQYFFTKQDGLRTDYTRMTTTNNGSSAFDTVTLSYVRRF